MKIKNKRTEKCISSCKCHYCQESIKKDERYLDLRKSAWKGSSTRVNICRGCLIKAFLELGVKGKELKEIKAKMTLNELEKENGK